MFKVLILFVLIFSLTFSASVYAKELQIQTIRQAIETSDASWHAAENPITSLSAQERQKLLVQDIRPLDIDESRVFSLPAASTLPDSFDWRNQNGNWITPVRDQGECGSCVAFAEIAQIESWYMIQNQQTTPVNLAEQFILSCTNAVSCEDGGRMGSVLDVAANTAIPLEKNFPYQASSSVACDDKAADWETGAVSIPDWGWVTLEEGQVENIKTAVLEHPVSTSMTVYSDFYSYNSGVYEHVIGKEEGGHAILIVGWNDREKSWICKNSWGESWGNDGYFRIKWRNSDFGAYSSFIWNSVLEQDGLFPSITEVRFSEIFGDSATMTFDIHNTSPDSVHYFIIEESADRSEQVNDWLTVENSAGVIPAKGVKEIKVKAQTRGIDVGDYKRTISISTNNSAQQEVKIPVWLTVQQPDHDIKADSLVLPPGGFPLLTWSSLKAIVRNIGKNEETLQASCTIYQNVQKIYTDTSSVMTLPANATDVIAFRPFKARQSGDIRLVIELLNLSNDYNDYNNYLTEMSVVSNLLESFEHETTNWHFSGGWGVSREVNGHDGFSSAHVNSGIIPYQNNQNAIMTFTPGFQFEDLDTLIVSFWERHVMADSNDICYVETSSDSITWTVEKELSGQSIAWAQHLVDFTGYIEQGADKAWLRFQFVSDHSGASIGALVDELRVYTGYDSIWHTLTDVEEKTIASTPDNWNLGSNYPNPFNPVTHISYTVPEPARVTLCVFNIRGQLVTMLQQAFHQPGSYRVSWDGKEYPSGVYIYQLQAENVSGVQKLLTKKMILAK